MSSCGELGPLCSRALGQCGAGGGGPYGGQQGGQGESVMVITDPSLLVTMLFSKHFGKEKEKKKEGP